MALFSQVDWGAALFLGFGGGVSFMVIFSSGIFGNTGIIVTWRRIIVIRADLIVTLLILLEDRAF